MMNVKRHELLEEIRQQQVIQEIAVKHGEAEMYETARGNILRALEEYKEVVSAEEPSETD